MYKMKTTDNADTFSSPASMDKQLFDLTLMKEKSQPVRRALFSKPDYPSAANAAAAPNLDDSSVSTVGSNTSGLYSTGSTRRRSLFSKYWVNTGESPSSSAASRSRPPTAIIEIADDQLSQEEEARIVDPILASPGSPPGVPRRSLFSHYDARRSVSLNCLDEVGENFGSGSTSFPRLSSNGSSPVRHNKSEGELISNNKKKPVSCLRESRFSFTKHTSVSSIASRESLRKSSSSVCSEASSVVQFDMESNEVRHFLKPTEIHAEDGWTNYFY